ncbi:S8 family peptidase [Natronosalvus rutilus]|uniref:S8 family serine peptidase n=1 Tax=Natronosalvus rutilus TaxID=2953753 RepID=A0A9E7SU05_9EURY|nr:S8 family serine peptidase [Natronosalvus rutilus]UTF52317.1 S8 family serine peptidase [Natronosalvus rutilus]
MTTRRSLLQGLGALGATITFAGLASASDGQARYLARTTGDAADAVSAAGFDVRSSLANGRVLLATGPADATDDLESVSGVSLALRDLAFELETPALVEMADTENSTAVDQVYDQYLWDKQVQQVREAHDHATGAGQTVAIIDTGVDDTHPDLTVDTERSVSIIEGQVGDHTGDVGYHGTHVAGTTAANGSVGMLGTAPDATIVSIRVFGAEGGATFGDILTGMEYAAEIGADAANMSIGTDPIPPAANADQYRRIMEPIAQSVTSAGTLLVGSAGNSDANLQQSGLFTLPNSLSGVLSVSATAPNDERAFYSNYGSNEIAVGAPGGGYETLEKTLNEDPDEVEWPYPTNLVYSTVPGGYAWLAGTSMAAPQVTGLAGLVRELAPGSNTRRVWDAIAQGAEGTDGRSDPEFGAGRTNALKTVERL